MGKHVNAIYADSCSMDLSAAMLVLAFSMMFILAVNQSLFAFIYLFRLDCFLVLNLSIDLKALILLVASCASLMLLRIIDTCYG